MKTKSVRRPFFVRGEVENAEYMVVTQRQEFNGYLGVDVSRILQFQEGEREAQVRKLLEAEGTWLWRGPITSVLSLRPEVSSWFFFSQHPPSHLLQSLVCME